MSPIESPHATNDPLLQRGADIAELVGTTISGALTALQRESRARLGSPLRRQCLDVVEHLWQRRAAVVRALALAPRASPAGTRLDAAQDAELGMALANSTRILYDAAEGEWRELQREARQRMGDAAPGQMPWPPAPNDCAAGLRWVVERTSGVHAVRLELMRLGTQLLIPRFVALCRRHLAHEAPAAPAAAAELAPAGPAAVAAQAPAALIDVVQAGQWFRMYLHGQWAAARLTWRSEKGHFFMFSSRLAGRSHSVSRSALERMIDRGQFEPLAHAPGDGAAGAA